MRSERVRIKNEFSQIQLEKLPSESASREKKKCCSYIWSLAVIIRELQQAYKQCADATATGLGLA